MMTTLQMLRRLFTKLGLLLIAVYLLVFCLAGDLIISSNSPIIAYGGTALFAAICMADWFRDLWLKFFRSPHNGETR